MMSHKHLSLDTPRGENSTRVCVFRQAPAGIQTQIDTGSAMFSYTGILDLRLDPGQLSLQIELELFELKYMRVYISISGGTQ